MSARAGGPEPAEPFELRLPDLGEGLEEAEVVKWLVAVGEPVERDQDLVEVQTDKANVAIPSPVAGVVAEHRAGEGAVVEVGAVLVVIAGAPAAEPVRRSPERAGPPARPVRARAAPSVRRLAVEHGVDLQAVEGTGPGGRVTADDVRAAANGATGEPPNGEREASETAATSTTSGPRHTGVAGPSGSPAGSPRLGAATPGRHPLRGIRRRTAQAMTTSWTTIPHITGMDEVDGTALLQARDRLRAVAEPGAPRLTLAPFLLRAVAQALAAFPLLNASLDGDSFVVHEGLHLGVATATPDGLVVPVVRHADTGGLRRLSRDIERLVTNARSGRLTPADLRGGTFTVSNYGSLGGRYATPLIRPPEVGIVGFGAIRPRPLVVDGEVVARPTLPICLSADHRLIDGDLASAFLDHVGRSLADPMLLLLEG